LFPAQLRLADLVILVLQLRALIVALDGKDLVEHGLQAAIGAFVGTRLGLKKLLVGINLHLDEVGRSEHLLDAAKVLAFGFAG
jgi:hypothetical protein